MGESSKFTKFETLEIQSLKLAGCPQKQIISILNDELNLENLILLKESILFVLFESLRPINNLSVI